ncbi:taurine catabolism dioxygenase TauD-like protein [Chloropicon primus]|uniref:Taurine catabolism dioxygenase TauD-like protein n=1 Tax=Chloropicon primus TaxID=1764295 RepID=A0A5B8MSM5_9CHLO|nr:taurine catabolism dioxygenase TauD-like protein [Chloropicon primus]|eukprot:QDZ23277.1 taurine catabolism dioxygenase TauD-like protein [Chloropicon primus]
MRGREPGRANWTTEEALRTRGEWEWHLSKREREAVLDGVANFKRIRGGREEAGGREDEDVRLFFPSDLLAKLEGVRESLIWGRGFALIRGVPIDQLSEEERGVAALLLGRSLGTLVPQNKEGHILGQVKNLGLDPNSPSTRIYATNAAQPFHTDSCDIVGLLCLHQAKQGGLSSFTSSVTIYEEIEREAPHLARVLLENFHVDRKGEVPKGKKGYYEMPIFHRTPQGKIACILDRSFITAAQRWDDVPPLDPLQVQALDLVERKAEENALQQMLEPGDLQLLHNHTILHSRSEFVDAAGEPPRHLLRLWICPPNGIALPKAFAERFGSVEVGNRGGLANTVCTRLDEDL